MSNNSKYKISIENRLTSVETILKEIKDNHLPHLEEKIDVIDSRNWWILGTIIIGVLINISFQLFK